MVHQLGMAHLRIRNIIVKNYFEFIGKKKQALGGDDFLKSFRLVIILFLKFFRLYLILFFLKFELNFIYDLQLWKLFDEFDKNDVLKNVMYPYI